MPSGSPYSPEDRERGLAALVIEGSSQRASELVGIPARTLREWREQDPEHFEDLRHRLEPHVAKKIAAEAEHLTQRSFQVQHKILDAFTDEEIQGLKPADKASALRNLQTHAALGIDKLSSPLRERPSHVQHTTGVDELVARLNRMLGFDAVSTAVELSSEPIREALSPESASSNARSSEFEASP